MYCAACGYRLDGLPAGPCPECAKRFDPLIRDSFDDEPWSTVARRAVRTNLLVALGPLYWFALLHAGRVVARIELGRWPVPSMDDPKEIEALRGLHGIMWLLMLAIPISLGVSIVLWISAGWRGRWALCAKMAITTIAIWCAFIVLSRIDPGNAMEWFAD